MEQRITTENKEILHFFRIYKVFVSYTLYCKHYSSQHSENKFKKQTFDDDVKVGSQK